MTNELLRDLLRPTRVILFDFDGPICSVFSGLPAPEVARRLEHKLSTLTDTSDYGPPSDDPLDVIRRAARYGPPITYELDQALEQAELEAIQLALPTPGADRCLEATVSSGRCAAVVTNNSAHAASAYLENRGLSNFVSTIVGRVIGQPKFMKPDPQSLTRALSELSTPAGEALMIGDSVSDIEAARRAGVPVLGFANRPIKHRRLSASDAVVEGMELIAHALGDLARPESRRCYWH